jgi:hypothetical protein
VGDTQMSAARAGAPASKQKLIMRLMVTRVMLSEAEPKHLYRFVEIIEFSID